MMNMPEVKLGIVAVSRDCFPITLSESRRKAVAAAYKGELYECPTVDVDCRALALEEDTFGIFNRSE